MSYSAREKKWVFFRVHGKDRDETGGKWLDRGRFDTRKQAMAEARILKGFGWSTKINREVYKEPMANPSRKKGPLKSPAKAVRLKNFTGTIRVNPNKTVSVVGQAKKRK